MKDCLPVVATWSCATEVCFVSDVPDQSCSRACYVLHGESSKHLATPRNTKYEKHLQSTQSAQPTNLTEPVMQVCHDIDGFCFANLHAFRGSTRAHHFHDRTQRYPHFIHSLTARSAPRAVLCICTAFKRPCATLKAR